MASSPSSHQEIFEYQQERQRSIPASLLDGAFLNQRGPRVEETLAKQLYQDQRKRSTAASKLIAKQLYDSLESEEKQMFMDIACFFNAKSRDMAIKIWKASQWRMAEHAAQTLLDKCLVQAEHYDEEWRGKGDVFRMHHHLRDLGRQMADEAVPRRLWRPEHLRSMREKGSQKILEETNDRCYDNFMDSSLNSRIEYFIGNSNNCAGTSSTALLWLGVDQARWERIPSWIPMTQLHYLGIWGLQELWSIPLAQIDTQVWFLFFGWLQIRSLFKAEYTFQNSDLVKIVLLLRGNSLLEIECEFQYSYQLRWLMLHSCRRLQNLPDLIEPLNHLEELDIDYSFESGTEGTSLSKSLTKLSNLKTLSFSNMPINGEVVLSITRGSTHFESCTSRCMNSLRMMSFTRVRFSKLVISGEMCPSLKHLEIAMTNELIEVELKLVKTVEILLLDSCSNLKTISELSSLTNLQELSICGCYRLENIEGVQELKELKSLVIQASRNTGVLNFISGLKRLPSDYTVITAETVDEAVSRLHANLFSDVIGSHAVAKIESSRDYRHKLEEIRNSSNAIIVCAFHVSAGHAYFLEDYSQPELSFYCEVEQIVTIVHTGRRNLKVSKAGEAEILEGFMATVNRGEEESEALTVFKVIIDHLYLP